MDILLNLPLSESRYLFLNVKSYYLNHSLWQFHYLVFAGPGEMTANVNQVGFFFSLRLVREATQSFGKTWEMVPPKQGYFLGI